MNTTVNVALECITECVSSEMYFSIHAVHIYELAFGRAIFINYNDISFAFAYIGFKDPNQFAFKCLLCLHISTVLTTPILGSAFQ